MNSVPNNITIISLMLISSSATFAAAPTPPQPLLPPPPGLPINNMIYAIIVFLLLCPFVLQVLKRTNKK